MTEEDDKRRGHLNKTGATLEEIASMYGCTRERIRQIESRALLKLRRALIRRNIDPDSVLPDNSLTDKY